jgi:uncharacterized protein involved in outer membrane biogenesis
MRFSTVLKILAVAALVVTVGLIAASKSLDSKRYQTFLAEQVKQTSGLTLTFSGPTKLKLGISPQVSFTGLALTTRPDGPPLLYIDRIEAQVALLPLVFREIRMEQVRLIRPTLRLEPLPAPAALDLTAPAERVPVTRFALADIRVDDAMVVWRNSPSAPESRLALSTARIQPETPDGGPLTVQAKGAWNGTGFELGGVVGSLRTLISAKPYPVQLKGSIEGAVVTARGTIAEPLSAKGIELELHAQGDELADILNRTGISLDGKPLSAIGPYKLAAKLAGSRASYALSEIDAVLGKRDNLLLGFKGEIKSLAPLGGLELAVTAEADALTGLSRLIAVSLPGGGPLKLTARLHEIENGWRLTGIKSSLGHSDFAGEMAFTPLPRPRFFGRLASTSFHPGEFGFPLAKSGTDPNRAAAPQRPAIPVIDGRVLTLDSLPLDSFRLFDLDLSLTAAKLVMGPAALTEASAEIHLSAGKLTVESFAAQMGDGQITGDARLDGGSRSPGLALRLAGNGLDFGKLSGGTPSSGMAGKGDLALDIKATGTSPRTLAASLEGSAWISMGETTLTKGGADDLTSRLLSALDAPSAGETPVKLRCAVLRLTARSGMVTSDKGLAAETARTAILGSATLDLRNETLDAVFAARGGGHARIHGMLSGADLVADDAPARFAPDASACRSVAKPRR